MFEKELAYFIREQDHLVGLYNGKVLVLQGERVLDVYSDLLAAYCAIKQNGQLGNVMLQPCIAGPGAYTAYIY